jgi:Zn-dependent protease
MTAFLIFELIALIFSVMIHEIAHGYVAERLGDDTARQAGRLTLNPIKHIDIFGSILLPLLLLISGSGVVLGWAKPVPYNPNNLTKDPKYGPLKVALAGPFTNILILLVLGLVARFGINFLSPQAVGLLGFVAYLNIFLAIFNLVPIPPLDGSKIWAYIFPRVSVLQVERLGMVGIIIVFAFVYFFSGYLAAIAAAIFQLVAGAHATNVMLGVLQSF